MPFISVSSFDFGLELPEHCVEDFSLDDLLTAMVTVGKSRADDLRTWLAVEECRHELVWRVSLVRMALTEAGGWFVQSGSYSRLDPSEKVGISYMLGLMATNALCMRHLNIPFQMHLDVYALSPARPTSEFSVTSEWLEALRSLSGTTKGSDVAKLDSLIKSVAQSFPPGVMIANPAYNSRVQNEVCRMIFGSTYTISRPYPGKLPHYWSFLTRLVRNARPDLFGVELDLNGNVERCVIAEAKGRSGRINKKEDRVDCKPSAPPVAVIKLNRKNGEAMLQALSRSHVNGVTVGRHLAIFAYFDKSGAVTDALHFSWKDPSGDALNKEERQKIPLGQIVLDYYASLLALGCPKPDAVSTGDLAHLSKCPVHFAVEDAGFSVEFHPDLHSAIVKAFEDEIQMLTAASKIPSLLCRLKVSGEIGKDTNFTISGVRIYSKQGQGGDLDLPGAITQR